MRDQLSIIEARRSELISRAEYDRQMLAENRLWVSWPLLAISSLIQSGQGVRTSPPLLQYAGEIIMMIWPVPLLRWTGRGLKAWMIWNRNKKNIRNNADSLKHISKNIRTN